MKLSAHLQIAILSIAIGVFQMPMTVQAATVVKPAALTGCYEEARWAIMASPAYVYGNARQREQQLHGFHADVYRLQRVCYAMTSAASTEQASLASECGTQLSESLKFYGDKARDHAVRLRDYCQTLSSQTVTVSGL